MPEIRFRSDRDLLQRFTELHIKWQGEQGKKKAHHEFMKHVLDVYENNCKRKEEI